MYIYIYMSIYIYIYILYMQFHYIYTCIYKACSLYLWQVFGEIALVMSSERIADVVSLGNAVNTCDRQDNSLVRPLALLRPY
jgi:hypothetical protein